MSQTNSETQTKESTVQLAGGNHEQLELKTLGLISELEMQLEKVSSSRNTQVEGASEYSNKLLTLLLDFTDENFPDGEGAASMKSIEVASFASLAHKEAIDTLSWGFAISNLFGKSICSDERVCKSYDKLGDAVLTACVTVLRQAVTAVGFDSSHAETIEQSSAIFVEQFRASW